MAEDNAHTQDITICQCSPSIQLASTRDGSLGPRPCGSDDGCCPGTGRKVCAQLVYRHGGLVAKASAS